MKAALHRKLNFFLGLIENILNICLIEIRMKINVFKFGGSQLLSPWNSDSPPSCLPPSFSLSFSFIPFVASQIHKEGEDSRSCTGKLLPRIPRYFRVVLSRQSQWQLHLAILMIEFISIGTILVEIPTSYIGLLNVSTHFKLLCDRAITHPVLPFSGQRQSVNLSG